MRKLIIPIVIASLLFTSGAVIDGLDNQDMTEPESHFW